MLRKMFRTVLCLSLALGMVFAAIPPRAVQAYGLTSGHPAFALEAIELVPAPDLLLYQDYIRAGAIDEDVNDHLTGYTCHLSICTCTHFWDADGTHANGPGGPFDWNKDIVFTFQDEFPNAFMKAQVYFLGWATENYEAGLKEQAFEYLGHAVHLLSDVSEPSHAHEDYVPGHGDFEDWVEGNYGPLEDGLWTAADAQAAGGPVAIPSWSDLYLTILALRESNAAHIDDIMLEWDNDEMQLYYLFYTANQYGDYFRSPDVEGDADEPYGWVNYSDTGDLRPGFGSFPVDAEGLPNPWPATDETPAQQVIGDYVFVYTIRAVAALYQLFLSRVDHVPPETLQTASGTVGANGWYAGDVDVTLSATDNAEGVGVKEITFSATGAQPIASTTVSGDSVLFTLTAEGTTQVTYAATDWGGNTEASHTVTFKIDKTAPTITINTPQPGAIMPVGSALDFGASDGVSGLNTMVATLSDGLTFLNVASGFVPSQGVYSLSVVATDVAGNEATETRDFVIFDASDGFVTGSGWFSSPAGAYPQSLTVTGRGTFGFDAKYQSGAAVPTGATEFHLKGADLKFRSSSYDWQVVVGSRAQFQGTGTINGAGSYGFLLTASDGDTEGGDGIDRFRIKIWEIATDVVVYDSQPGDPDYADPSTLIGGSIAIHM